MKTKEKCIFCWSGGKDSALALHMVMQENKYEVAALLTTLNGTFKRTSMHGVREILLDQQAAAIGLPLIKMYVTEGTNEEYEKNMEAVLLKYKSQGVTKIIFGDIFLEDLRAYREKNLEKVGLTAEFPLWKRDTKELIYDFWQAGFKTITCCVNNAYLDYDKVGVEIDKKFIETLPANVDPCGENGEFHSFCYEGPVFKKALRFKTGDRVYKPLKMKTDNITTIPIMKGFWYCDLLPV